MNSQVPSVQALTQTESDMTQSISKRDRQPNAAQIKTICNTDITNIAIRASVGGTYIYCNNQKRSLCHHKNLNEHLINSKHNITFHCPILASTGYFSSPIYRTPEYL